MVTAGDAPVVDAPALACKMSWSTFLVFADAPFIQGTRRECLGRGKICVVRTIHANRMRAGRRMLHSIKHSALRRRKRGISQG